MADVQIEDGIIRVVQLDIQDPKAAAVLAAQGKPMRVAAPRYAEYGVCTTATSPFSASST